MKSIVCILLFIVGLSAQAKSLVLISYFDPFGKASTNNSQVIAQALADELNGDDIEIKLCPLETIFDKAYGQLEKCIKDLSTPPSLVLSLGESTCDLKIELRMKNIDKTYGPDNAGNERNNIRIIPEAADSIGLNFPLAQMYCALNSKERSPINVSSDAGTFVCNNTAFQMSYYYPELPYGLIHVPTNDCRHLNVKNANTIFMLTKMIVKGVEHVDQGKLVSRLPVNKRERESVSQLQNDSCLKEFYSRIKY